MLYRETKYIDQKPQLSRRMFLGVLALVPLATSRIVQAQPITPYKLTPQEKDTNDRLLGLTERRKASKEDTELTRRFNRLDEYIAVYSDPESEQFYFTETVVKFIVGDGKPFSVSDNIFEKSKGSYRLNIVSLIVANRKSDNRKFNEFDQLFSKSTPSIKGELANLNGIIKTCGQFETAALEPIVNYKIKK